MTDPVLTGSDDEGRETGASAARRALREIEATQSKSRAFDFYHANSLTLMVWGCVWLVCNTVSFYRPDLSDIFWMTGITIGAIASAWGGWQHQRSRPSLTGRKEMPLRHIALGIVIALVLIVAISAIVTIGGLQDSLQINAIISLFIGVGFIMSGLYQGWRMSALGAFVAAAALIGWFVLNDWYELWMGLVGGGALLLGGYWMRQV